MSVVLRQVQVSEATGSRRRVYFELPVAETGDAGEQPDISVDGAAWSSSGIGTLSHIGQGVYYAELTSGIVDTVGQLILTRYYQASTFSYQGDRVLVVDFDPTAAIGGASASDIWTYSGGDGRTVNKIIGGGSGTITAAGVWALGDDGDTIEQNVWGYGSGRNVGDVEGKVLGGGGGTITDIGIWSDMRAIYSNNTTSNMGLNFATFFENATVATSVTVDSLTGIGGGGSLTASDVWTHSPRTLTAAPTGLITVNDVWSHSTRTLTSAPTGLITASDVWNFGTRSLTAGVAVTGVVDCNLVRVTGVLLPNATLNLDTLQVGRFVIDSVDFVPFRILSSVVTSSSPTASGFAGDIDLAASSGIYEKMWLHFMDGTLSGISRVVDTYSGPGRIFTFTDNIFPAVPASGDSFVLISYTDR